MKEKIKLKVFKLKDKALLLLFGIKPPKNKLKFNKIQVVEREITPEMFNNWSKSILKM